MVGSNPPYTHHHSLTHSSPSILYILIPLNPSYTHSLLWIHSHSLLNLFIQLILSMWWKEGTMWCIQRITGYNDHQNTLSESSRKCSACVYPIWVMVFNTNQSFHNIMRAISSLSLVERWSKRMWQWQWHETGRFLKSSHQFGCCNVAGVSLHEEYTLVNMH